MELEQDQERSESRGTSKAQLHEQDSEFGDQNCGEPLVAQRLLIDFTPDQELDLDSEYNQNKCRAFWDFIKSKPELQHLMAVPGSNGTTRPAEFKEPNFIFKDNLVKEAVDYGESFTSSDYQQSESSGAPEPMERTAISTLELVQKEGPSLQASLMAPAFLGMMPQSHCSLGSREYPEPVIAIKKAKKKTYVCACKGSCSLCRRNNERSRARAPSDAVAVDLCKNIKKWDADHPKSMEPPGHPSNLCSARRTF